MKSSKERVRELWGDRENQSKYFRWLLSYSKPYIWKITLMILVSVVGTMISIQMAVLSKNVIDRATAGQPIISILILYILCMLVMEATGVITSLVSTMMNEHFSFGIRKQVYDKIIRSTWLETEKYHTGDLMTRMTSDAGNIADGIVNVIPSVIELLIELIAVFCTLFAYSKFLAIFSLFLTPFGGLASLLLGRKLKFLQVKVQESETSYRSFIQESLANLLIVKAFTNENLFSDELVRLREERFSWVWKKSKLGVGASTSMSAVFEIGYIAAFTYGVLQISAKAITYGTLTVFLTLVNRVQTPVIQLAGKFPALIAIIASAGRVMDIQNIPLEKHQEDQLVTEQIGVTVRNLTFGYNKDVVLEDVSFDIKPGEFVAIVGESGIGKTTLIRLLLSFVNPDRGSIIYTDCAGNKVDANADVRKFISYVPQGNTLFSGTLRSNILMGKANATKEELDQAIDLSSSRSFLKDMPDGVDTVIGEKGLGVSEGQAQRIAIARAFIRKSPFIILDEATSALDEVTELKVLGGLRKLEPRPTCLLITHRRSVLQYCDRELKIENRRMSEISNLSLDNEQNRYI